MVIKILLIFILKKSMLVSAQVLHIYIHIYVYVHMHIPTFSSCTWARSYPVFMKVTIYI